MVHGRRLHEGDLATHPSQSSLDRMFCRLRDWEPLAVEMVGQERIPGLTRVVSCIEPLVAEMVGQEPLWVMRVGGEVR